MLTSIRPWIVLAVLIVAALFIATRGLGADSANPSPPPAAQDADLLYDDSAARSSATITQVLPNSSTSQMTLDNVRRIRVKQEILIIEWGATATTLLPRQFISAITINKRNPAPSSAATQPTPK